MFACLGLFLRLNIVAIGGGWVIADSFFEILNFYNWWRGIRSICLILRYSFLIILKVHFIIDKGINWCVIFLLMNCHLRYVHVSLIKAIVKNWNSRVIRRLYGTFFSILFLLIALCFLPVLEIHFTQWGRKLIAVDFAFLFIFICVTENVIHIIFLCSLLNWELVFQNPFIKYRILGGLRVGIIVIHF